MKIVIDGTVYSSAPSGGVYRYFNELIPRLANLPDTKVQIFSPRTDTLPPNGENIEVKKDLLPSGQWFPEGRAKEVLRKAKRWVSAFVVGKQLGGVEGAVYHSTFYTPSPWKNLPEVFTVYDMISELFPDLSQETHIVSTNRMKRECVERAARLIAISENTKQDLHRIWGVPLEKIDAIHLGVKTDFFSRAIDATEKERTLEKYSICKPFVFFLGGRLHHKNFSRLLEAYEMSEIRQSHTLVVAGAPWSQEEEKRIQNLGLEKHVLRIPSITEVELPVFYQCATLFVFPSYYEGFGLPLLEAMAAGCPVAAANAGPFPEIVQGAALLFDPYDPADMAKKMDSLLNTSLRERYRDLGLQRSAQFSWDETARKTRETYKKAIGAGTKRINAV